MEFFWDFQIYLIASFQSLGSWLVGPMQFLSFFGSEGLPMLLVPLIYWNINALIGLQMSLILLISSALNDFFKIIFHDPRPYWYSTKIIAYAAEPSFGLPSGHSQNAMAFWAMLALGLRKRWLWVVSITLIFLIGLSLIYLGVHFPTDVLAGWLIGALVLLAFITFWKPTSTWLKAQQPGLQVLYAFLTSLLLIGLSILARFLIRDWTIPEIWLTNAALNFPAGPQPDPLVMEGVITSSGTFFGFLAGLVWMNKQGGFSIEGQTTQRVGRYILGLVGVIIIYIGLKLLFPQGNDLISYIFRYVRYAMIGVWVSAGAPWLFIRMHLMEKAN
jgi:membrane-associated phospholipid phosphatase